MSKFWQAYPHIQTELGYVSEIVKQKNKSSEAYLNASIDYMLLTGGKMIRPAFVLLGAGFGPEVKDSRSKLHHLAASIETLHLATLVHDDIIDESKLRRGQESIQSKFGKPYAVYLGDYLFTQCFLMLTDFDFDGDNIKRVAQAMKKVCIGEMLQYHRRYKLDKSTKNYLKVISGKTAALFAISMAAGAYENGVDDKTARALGRVGYNIGMAFQIIDDLLDYKADSSTFGKDTRADIIKGYYTLPIIRTLGTDMGPRVSQILDKDRLLEDDITDLIGLTKASGAIASTEKLAQKYTDRALKQLESLPDCESRRILLEIVPKMLGRNK